MILTATAASTSPRAFRISVRQTWDHCGSSSSGRICSGTLGSVENEPKTFGSVDPERFRNLSTSVVGVKKGMWVYRRVEGPSGI